MSSRPSPDVVSPDRVRRAPRRAGTGAALEARPDVLAAKPFTVDPADPWAIDALARERGRHVVLCYAWNEMGIAAAARRAIHGPDGIGEVEHVYVRDVDDRPRPAVGRADLSRGRRRPIAARQGVVRTRRCRAVATVRAS